MPNSSRWFFAWAPEPSGTQGANKGVMPHDVRWRDRVVSVSFLDGPEQLRKSVRAVASEWTAPGLANLVFDFRDDNETDIRISFRSPGSWSMLGSSCRNVTDVQRATMNYGWFTPDMGAGNPELRRTVLHEFGHALGLIHEHQSPVAAIPWDRDRVIADLSGPPNNWTARQIEVNLFDRLATGSTNHSKFDPDSIMIYPIPPEWTGGKLSVPLNGELSPTDRRFIAEMYPL